jgi:hypothetical protein
MGDSKAGLSRRAALKRIGAGAAIAWTAPVLLSIETPASAGSVALSCSNCGTDFCSDPSGCAGINGCSDGSAGFCDTTVEGQCVCDVVAFVDGTQNCTSSAACAKQFGSSFVCIQAGCLPNPATGKPGTTVCTSQCDPPGPLPSGFGWNSTYRK